MVSNFINPSPVIETFIRLKLNSRKIGGVGICVAFQGQRMNRHQRISKNCVGADKNNGSCREHLNIHLCHHHYHRESSLLKEDSTFSSSVPSVNGEFGWSEVVCMQSVLFKDKL